MRAVHACPPESIDAASARDGARLRPRASTPVAVRLGYGAPPMKVTMRIRRGRRATTASLAAGKANGSGCPLQLALSPGRPPASPCLPFCPLACAMAGGRPDYRAMARSHKPAQTEVQPAVRPWTSRVRLLDVGRYCAGGAGRSRESSVTLVANVAIERKLVNDDDFHGCIAVAAPATADSLPCRTMDSFTRLRG